ncbi:MAG: hypothetical protein ACR2OZ_19575 [Verrucomicrobiales bacterium]
MKPVPLVIIIVLWIASLAGVFWIGKRQGQELARTEASRELKMVQENGGLARTRPPAVGAKERASGEAATSDSTRPTVKQILAQVKALLRSGGMNNPATGIKALTLLGQVRDEDLQEALKEAEATTEPQQKMMLYMVLLGKWAEKDGPAAMKYADEKLVNAGPMIQMAKMGIISSWAQTDPEAAWQWYRNKSPDEGGSGPMGGRSMALMGLFASMAGKDLDGALKKTRQLETPEERRMAMMGLFQSSYDDETRLRLMKETDAITDADDRKQTRQMIVGQWAMLEPEKASQWIDSLPSGDERKEAARTAGSTLMMSDPKKGAEFMLKHSEEKDRASTYDTIASTWANQDANGAGAWLGQQPQGPELDKARASFARIAANRDPESAMEWAKTVTNEEQRRPAVEQVYKTWRKKDGPAAEQALQNSGLPSEKIDEIIRTAQEKDQKKAAEAAVKESGAAN